jgi:hypothetical protein
MASWRTQLAAYDAAHMHAAELIQSTPAIIKQ